MNPFNFFWESFTFCRKNLTGIFATIAAIALFIALPAFRYATIYNLTSLFCLGLLVTAIIKYPARGSFVITIYFITLAAIFFNIYNCMHFGASYAFDEKEYFFLGQSIASGNGLAGTTYREPLYPAIVGLFSLAGDASGQWIIIFQHIILVCCVPGIYYIALLCGFSELTGCIAAMFLSLNSLLMQSAGFIMTEILFCSAILACTALLIRWYRTPTPHLSILTGLMFAITACIKQLFFPVFFAGIVIMIVKRKRKGLYACLIVILSFAAGTAPWSLRNFIKNNNYSISSSLGIQLFTKAVTFDCIDIKGRYFKNIEKPLLNVMTDLHLKRETGGLNDDVHSRTKKLSANPEDNWQINRIPHTLMDSLKTYHGYSGFAASKLLGKVAIEGFAAHPVRYIKSIANSFLTLMFRNREIYPNAGFVLPVNINAWPLFLHRIANNMIQVSGYILLLFPVAILVRRNKSAAMIIPFGIVCCMDLIIAAVQIGFTRYAVPWEPFKAICAAYVIETIILFGKKLFTINQTKSRFTNVLS
jgi:hypothetical protein